MRVLLTGGAGYIGSHTARYLEREGHEVIVLDDLSTGHAVCLRDFERFEADLVRDRLEPILHEAGCEAVIHFAGKALVPESVRDPALYYRTNMTGGLRLLEAMRRTGVRRIVFSSTCAVYGVPAQVPITESCLRRPFTAYGRSKLAFEHALEDFCTAYSFGAMALRYFNAAGAEMDGSHGEDHNPETHLVPRILQAAQTGEAVSIFGTDYPTPDGTCVRDYVHLDDLARAHALALAALEEGRFDAVNIGTGTGTSVREVIETARRVTGLELQVVEAPRRPGDPPELTAAVGKAREVLGFEAEHGIDAIVRSAWAWHDGHPRGYGEFADENAGIRFGEIAVQLGVVDEDGIDRALRQQEARSHRGDSHMLLGLVLLDLGLIDSTQLIAVLRAYQEIAGVRPMIRLR